MYGFVATLNVPFLLIILNHDTHITLDLLMQDESGGEGLCAWRRVATVHGLPPCVAQES